MKSFRFLLVFGCLTLVSILAGCSAVTLPPPVDRQPGSSVAPRPTVSGPSTPSIPDRLPTDTGSTQPDLILPGTVIRVLDGDTADVQLDSGPIRVRFHGVDAPEKPQPLGKAAGAHLATMIQGRVVEVLPVDQDAYDRIVGVLYLGETNVNAEMVRTGYAWAYRKYLGALAGDADYCRLEGQARESGFGLWSLSVSERLPPWEYRADKRNGGGLFTDYSDETVENCIAAMGKGPREVGSPTWAPPVTPKSGCSIKGNINSKGERIYHVPGRGSYAQTEINEAAGERWFCSEDEARQAGWRAPR
ncbi:MAG: thermonuclease family protein [Gammaproteobacteria bacterium]|nr:thermonuclease family protein [Gammaproteobacteria bacterium]